MPTRARVRQQQSPRALPRLRAALVGGACALLALGAASPAAAAGTAANAAAPTTVAAPFAALLAPAKSTPKRPAAKTKTSTRSRAASTLREARARAAANREARRASLAAREREAARRERDAREARALRAREAEIAALPTFAVPDLAQLFGDSAAAAFAATSANAAPAPMAQAAGGAEPRGAFTALGRSAAALLDQMVSRARSQLGTRYVLGAATPGEGLDCSSFARYAMEALGIRLPRTAAQQARVGTPVPRERGALRPGDLLTFGTRRTVDHVGIYLGEGRFIHASVKSGRVIETTFERNGQLLRKWQGARRLLAESADGAPRGG